ncbi:16S rRNA (cytosine(1402)-N(4))-methyltransferase RsmH [Mycobacterium sp.]|uniref:16S rRNA (cytosine(1402)-N(4))-methyltransferase RsmH n=1 Tax=Mycobacterium sp. TaxID=1785 RepID=UPI002DA8D3B0|nr:16S rRNA (cytosine(1402)-N(4))-methyltransferase RsmH [Mycobacterium sp.]
MKLYTTSSDAEVDPAAGRHVARASWPLPEPALAYFPNARSGLSGRDLDAGALDGDVAMAPDRPHIPVLLDRCVELLKPALTRQHPDGTGAVLIDATLGAGGHAERFLTEFVGLRLIGLDRDPDALWIAGERLSEFGDRVMLVRTRYDGIEGVLAETGYWADKVDGILFDLGVSSMQLDRTERGFSYAADAPLDMRMDPDAALTAADVINTYDERALARVLREFGEERFASRIAAQIVRRRARKPFATTGELVELLYEAIPAPARRTGGHPAKRTFQALRIAVNGELDSLRDALPAALGALTPGGRIVVMAYQSLEDRIVKNKFAAVTASRTPPGLPVELPGHEPEFVALTRGAERAGAEEIELNPRSASVRLRALEKVGG